MLHSLSSRTPSARRARTRFAWLVLVTLAFPAIAQDTPPATATGTGVQAPPPPTTLKRRDEDLFKDESGREVPVSQYIPLSDQAVQEMRKELNAALETVNEARESKDAVRLNCVNDKVTAMKGILRISEDAMVALQEAMVSNANEKARYEFGKIKVAKKKMGQLAREAKNCAGAEASYTGEAEVTLEEDEELLGTDPYYGYGDFFANPEDYVSRGDQSLPGDGDSVDGRLPPVSSYQGD